MELLEVSCRIRTGNANREADAAEGQCDSRAHTVFLPAPIRRRKRDSTARGRAFVVVPTPMRGHQLVACGAIVLGLFASRDAEASGYLSARFGADHGTPAMPNTYAVYFNPAALGGTKGTTIVGNASVLLRFASYRRTTDALSPSDPALLNDADYVRANTGKAELTNLLVLPFVGMNTDFGTRDLRFGYAAYIPFGGSANWDRPSGVPGSPGSNDGPQRWHNISGQLMAIYNTFAVAYRIAPARLSIGASVSPIIHTVRTLRAKNSDGSDDTVIGGQVIEGRSLVEASGINLGASVGLYYEPIDRLHLGLSYLSQPGFGDTRMSGTLKTQLGAQNSTSQDVDFLQTYPDIVRFGSVVSVSPRLDLRADFEFVRWSVLERQCIVNPDEDCKVAGDGRDESGGRVILNVPRHWNNAIGVRAGPAFYLNEQTEIFGSLSFSTPASPKKTIDASTIDSQRLYFTAGLRYKFSEHFALAGSYNHIYFFPVDTKGANDLNISAHPASSPGGGDYNASRSPSADGKYKQQVGSLNLNIAYTF